MALFFTFIFTFFKQRKLLLLILSISVVIISAYFATRLNYEENITKMLPDNNQDFELSEIIQNSNVSDRVFLNIYNIDIHPDPEPEKLIDASEELNIFLDSLKSAYIKNITFKFEESSIPDLLKLITVNLPLYLDSSDYGQVEYLLSDSAINSTFSRNYKSIISPAGIITRKTFITEPTGISYLVLKKLQDFQVSSNITNYSGYFFSKDKRNQLIIIQLKNPANETSANSDFLFKLDKKIKEIQDNRANKIKIEYYGAPSVAVSNARQLKSDITFTLTSAIIIIILVIGIYFRNWKIAFLSFLPAIFGGSLALGIIYLIKPAFSAIALGVCSVILGIIVDYSLYIFNKFREQQSIPDVLRDMSFSIAVCCLTTVSAFFCLLLVSSEVLHDIGLLAGLSIIFAALFSLVILPHLIGKSKPKPDYKPIEKFKKIINFSYHKSKSSLIIIIILTLLSLIFFLKAGFERDINSLNYLTPELAKAEKNLNRISDFTSKNINVITSGENLNEAMRKTESLIPYFKSLKSINLISSYSSPGTFIISDSLRKFKLELWAEFWTEQRKSKLINSLKRNCENYGLKFDSFSSFTNLISNRFSPDDSAYNEIRRIIKTDEFITQSKIKIYISNILKTEPEKKQVIYSTLRNIAGLTIFDKQYLTDRFVESSKEDFELLVWLSLIFVTIVLIISFGRFETGLIAAIPMFLSWFWTLGFMGITGLKFNIFNIIISTFIFGLGVDYSVLVMRGLLNENKTGKKDLNGFKSAVFISSATTIIGVSVLLFAKHPALNSISLISVFGMLSVVFIAYTIEPFLFNYIILKRKQQGKIPKTLLSVFFTFVSFSYFVIGSLLISLIGFTIFTIIPLPSFKNIRKTLYHYLIWSQLYTIVRMMINVKRAYLNRKGDEFRKPCVLISNHQSLLDILILIHLHPKIILLTNDWVWNSPIYGRVVRFADYHPVTAGLTDEGIKKLGDLVKGGYSIAVFPEGTRSKDGRILRFHKGAFYIAEKLNLPIQPVLIHGSKDSIPKGEFLLRSGDVKMKFLDKIYPDDESFGKDYSSRAKTFTAFYREEYEKLRKVSENPEYFRDELIKNYIYKGPILEWYLRIKLRLENNYKQFHELVPTQGKILDIGCGYGFMTNMLSFLSDKREITGIDFDEEKIQTAQNCPTKRKNTNFFHYSALDFNFDTYDTFILSDFLHYIPHIEQEKILIKCIDNLNPGGCIIIRDANTELNQRHKGTRLTEFFSINFSFNKSGDNLMYFADSAMLKKISEKYNLNLEVIDKTKFTSNIIYVLKRTDITNAKL